VSAELERAEQKLAEAVRASDAEAAGSLLADEFALTSSLGTGLHVDKTEWLATMGQIATESLQVRDLQARELGDIGVVVWLQDWHARIGGDDLSGEYVVSDVWRHDSEWRLVWRAWARLNAELER
jgi:ketosteroid isomerase-like protein